jgi:protein TonB
MFEDSTFESNGRIRTRSRRWMIAAFTLNGSILLALVLIPLIYPQALQPQMIAYLMEAPALQPAPQPKPQARLEHANVVQSEMRNGQIFAPSVIPNHITMVDRPETLPEINVADWGSTADGPGGNNPFRGQTVRPVVRPDPRNPVRVPSTVVSELLLQKTIPTYPPIARATMTQGTVVLEATISRAGTIEDLRVASGPPMLQQAALDAVKTWRYRPYLLNGEPVAVETTVNVVFTLGR